MDSPEVTRILAALSVLPLDWDAARQSTQLDNEAPSLLAEIYDRFSEGHSTFELKDALWLPLSEAPNHSIGI